MLAIDSTEVDNMLSLRRLLFKKKKSQKQKGTKTELIMGK